MERREERRGFTGFSWIQFASPTSLVSPGSDIYIVRSLPI
jgi:hypothetical protein